MTELKLKHFKYIVYIINPCYAIPFGCPFERTVGDSCSGDVYENGDDEDELKQRSLLNGGQSGIF